MYENICLLGNVKIQPIKKKQILELTQASNLHFKLKPNHTIPITYVDIQQKLL